jgi:hypothetical protein
MVPYGHYFFHVLLFMMLFTVMELRNEEDDVHGGLK